MRGTPRLAVITLGWIALAWPLGAAAQVVDGTPIPQGLTASDWSSVRAAYAAGRHAASAARNTLTIGALAEKAYLKSSNTGQDDGFGRSVAVSGNTLVVGAPLEDSSAAGVDGNQADDGALDSGAVYVFVRNGSTWTQQAYLKASNPDPGDSFGDSVAISGDTLVVGAPLEDSSATGVDGDPNNDANLSGAAYVFVRSGTTWSQQAYLKASNTGGSDAFGWSVSISGDTLVVGALQEDSNATGVGGDQGDNSASSAGAVYVFVRSGTTWSQQTYLKASNSQALDLFGMSVSITGDTLVVGAIQEDSNATEVDGDQDDDSASAAGAAYAFVRSGTTWSQQAYLKAPNTGAGDALGASVGVSGDTIVVGASSEASNTTGVNGDQVDDTAAGAGAAYVFDSAPGSTWWVDDTAACPGSGTVAAPFCALTDAITAAALRGDTIIVRDGTYTGTGNTGLAFSSRALTLRSEHGPDAVTLDGQHIFGTSLVTFVGGEGPDTVFAGFTLRGGANHVGGGISCTNSSPTIRNCIVVDNYASMHGGGIAVDGGSPTILDCVVADNASGSPPILPGRGAGVALLDSGATLRGVTIAHNVATAGLELPGQGGGLYVSNSPDASLVSTIVWGNVASDGAGIKVASGAAPAANHCDVQGGFVGTAMLATNPKFVVAGPFGDYHLQTSSRCIGTGDTSAVAPGETDIDGEARVQGGAVEIGADELSEDPWVDLGDGTSGILGTPVLVMSGPLLPSSLLTLDLSAASPSSLAVLFLSLSSTPAPFLGGLLHAHPIDELVVLATDGSGTLGGSIVFPALPGGTELWFQIGIADPSVPVFGASLSNGVKGTVP